MVNVYNRRLAFKDTPEPGLMGGIVPVAPPNRLCMLTDYIEPQERMSPAPIRTSSTAPARSRSTAVPVVIQVPDFGDRFWVYQVVDLRTDSFADLGAMYGTKPGFYLLVGPNWKGEGRRRASPRSSAPTTNTGFVIPRVFQDDTPEDKKAVQR